MTKVNPKAQITMFIILGIIILVSFLFLFFISNFIAEQRLEQQRQEITQHPFDAALVQRFTSICVDDALKKGIELIGMHGGFIFDASASSGEPAFITTAGGKVAAAIGPSVETPLYPCVEQFASKAPGFCHYGDYNGIIQFGSVQLPPLEGGAFSIEGILKKYISSYVKDCLTVQSFAADAGLSGYHVISEGDPSSSIEFRDNEIYVAVEYPLSVDIGGEEPITRFATFESRLQIRFRQLYAALQDAAQKDVANNSFPLLNAHASEFFTVSTIRVREPVRLAQLNPSVAVRSEKIGVDDLLTIEDSSSRVENRKYVFRLARRNRAPALEYIQRNPSYLYDTQDALKDTYDFLVIKGELVVFEPQAKDPDEGTVQFSYLGDFGSSAGATFTASTAAISSGTYKQKVTVSDGHAADFQDVRVLVDAPLDAAFVVKNHIGQENIISPEDPFILDARDVEAQTHDQFAQHTFDWQLFADGQTFLEGTGSACSQLPGDFDACGSDVPDIDMITDATTRWPSLDHAITGSVQLTATRTYAKTNASPTAPERVLTDTTTEQITIVPCVLHSSADAPYPFNLGDPYLANHACCEGDPADARTWNIKESSAVCHEQEACKDGYFLARKSYFCNGIRGNICGNDFSLEPFAPQLCGETALDGCNTIPASCQRETPWSVVNGDWCYGGTPSVLGATGCEQTCDRGEIVYVGNDPQFTFTGNVFQNVPGRTDFSCGCGGFSALNRKCLRTTDLVQGTCSLLGACG